MKKELLYEGKAKRVYQTDEPGCYLVDFKDDATAFNGEKKGTITGKGRLNNAISSHFFELLAKQGVPSHFIRQIDERQMLVKQVKIIPIEVVVRNIAAGSLAKRLGLAEGTSLKSTVVEFYYKDDALGDPLINRSHIRTLGIAQEDQVAELEQQALRINEVLENYLFTKGLLLVDFKLEFGVTSEGQVLLADEISPDTCRFWDASTHEKLDKDRFRRELGSVEEAYQEIWQRLGGTTA
ncbi:MAG: phosphoribosylaminoimidazole-succinocarboxamide synthase [Bacilli bacterium]|nr:phosphoribosylaminoimidazole-succinocarboxamide synthase [Bacilli bacterium]